MIGNGTTFANHRGVVPMLWAFFSLALLEIGAVHLFVTLRWPLAGWPLTAISGAAMIWIVIWIASWKRLPHRLDVNRLTLHMGRLRKIEVPLDAIRAITPVNPDRLKSRETRNLVPLACPNRLIELSRPVGKRASMCLAIRVDEAERFDIAMVEALAQRPS